MASFIETFIELTEDKKVNLLGFGGKPNFVNLKSDQTSFNFPLSGDPSSPLVDGLPGCLSAYEHAISNVELASPTYFAPLLQGILSQLQSGAHQSNRKDGYSVLLAVTDGMFFDVQQTIDLIVEASLKPFSLILVGLGEDHNEFEGFYHLGSTECRDSKGRHPARNLCRFVHFE